MELLRRVQQPLATVVVFGIIGATGLMLLVFPGILMLALKGVSPAALRGQSEDEAVETAGHPHG